MVLERERESELLEKHQGLIWSVVRRFLGCGVDADDLYQLACLGFLKAVRGFDEDYGTQFSTYAVPKIMGEIRRFLRDDGSVKVSRGLKEQGARINRQKHELEQALGREPRLSELAEATGLSPEEVAAAETAGLSAVSFQQEFDDGMTLESVLGDDGVEDRLVESLALRQAMERLPEQERHVLSLRYFHSLTQQETARIVGVSQVQVSRLERRAMERLRRMLE